MINIMEQLFNFIKSIDCPDQGKMIGTVFLTGADNLFQIRNQNYVDCSSSKELRIFDIKINKLPLSIACNY
jgi:hypothetical protein